MKLYKFVCLFIVTLSLWATISDAKVYIDIDSPTMSKFPIAITDFKNLGKASDRENLSVWFSDQLAKSLSVTNYFNIIDKGAYLESPGQNGLTSTAINFSDWVSIGAESLVKGGFQYDGRELVCEFMLFDVVMGKLIAGKKYVGKLQNRREMVLKFCDEILRALTGERGVFDTRIAFSGKQAGSSEIYSIGFDGSPVSLAKLTELKSLTILPQWSPNGIQMTFTSYRSGNPDVYLIAANGGRETKLTGFKGLTLAGPWAPDGKSTLITSSRDGKEEIYKMELQGRQLQRLTSDPAINVSPSWSPDGRRIAFVSDRAGSPQIYVMDADGSNVKRLTFEGNYNTSPRWSPKGDRIAFEGLRNGSFQILTMDPSGSTFTLLTTDGRNDSPSWSPDGRYITFVSSKKGRKPRLCIINANGSNLRVLHEGMDQYLSPSWSPHLNF